MHVLAMSRGNARGSGCGYGLGRFPLERREHRGVGSDWAQTDTTLDCGQTYHISGWTVPPSSDTRFTNDGTGHGMSASIENVYSFLLQVMKFSRWEEVNRLKTIAALVAATPLARSYWALAPARLIATPTATTAATPAITASPTATEARGG
jgi:hypothetical protein